MAVPDPYKAAKPKINLPVPKSGGVVPAPTTTKSSSNLPPVPTGGTPVPKPTTTMPKSGLNPIVSSAVTVPKPPSQPKSTFQSQQYADWDKKTQENYANLEEFINKQFTYDPETDPAYQAQRQLAQLRAGDASRNALETANEKGILGSSMNVSQLGQIQQRAEQEAAAYIPEYRNQAYGQHQDRIRNAGILLGESRGLGSDQFNQSVIKGEMLGSYVSPEAEREYNELVQHKAMTEKNWSNMTAEQRIAANQEGDRRRSLLQGMGIDISKLGKDVTSSQAAANRNSIGVKTLAGQNQQFNQDLSRDQFDRGNLESDRNFDRGVLESDRGFNEGVRQYNTNLEYTQGRDAVKDKQWQTEFDRILKQDGVQNALAWAQHNLSASRESRIASGGSGGSGSSSDGQESSQVKATASEMSSLYTNLLQQYGTADSEGKYKAPTSQQGKQSIINRILDFNLPDDQTENLLRRFNMTVAEAEKILNAPAPKQPELPTREQVTKDLLNFKF